MSKRKATKEPETDTKKAAKAAKVDVNDPVQLEAKVPSPVAEPHRWPNIQMNSVSRHGAAGPVVLCIDWRRGVAKIRADLQEHLAKVKNYLAELKAPLLCINAVVEQGLCGIGTVSVLYAPDASTVVSALGTDFATFLHLPHAQLGNDLIADLVSCSFGSSTSSG
jgi:hypothetical protein